MKQPPQSRILNPKPASDGFLVGKNWDDPKLYAAVPLAGSTTKLVIIHEGKQLKVCRNEQAARNFIAKHKRSNRGWTGKTSGTLNLMGESFQRTLTFLPNLIKIKE